MSSDPLPTRAVPVRSLALGLALAALACRPPGAGPAPSADIGGGEVAVRVIDQRRTPRTPFDLRLRPEGLGGDVFVLHLSVQSPRGGTGRIEFSLPEGFEVLDGTRDREFQLEPGEVREEAITVRVPPAGDRAVAAAAVVDGRRDEAYAVFGEPGTAEAQGLRIRRRPDGDGVLRIDAGGAAR